MWSSVILRLRKLHLRSIRGNYVRTQTVTTIDGKQQEVTVYSGDNCLFLGQYTPLGTIVIHERVFENEKLFNYVITHEMAHKKQWWSLFRIPLAFIAIFSAPDLLVLSITSIGNMLTTGNAHLLLNFLTAFLPALFLLALPFTFSWILELDADFHSIRMIGFQTFQELINDGHSQVNANFRTIINMLLHPPASITIYLWNHFHGGIGEKREIEEYPTEVDPIS
jgi:Zn-dependent protease with chaperone function